MSEKFILITWTCKGVDEAREISRELVQMNLVACANILPQIESVFMWNQKLEAAQESKVFFKTRSEHFQEIKNFILKKASYEVPEILKFNISDGNKDYLEWVEKSTLKNKE